MEEEKSALPPSWSFVPNTHLTRRRVNAKESFPVAGGERVLGSLVVLSFGHFVEFVWCDLVCVCTFVFQLLFCWNFLNNNDEHSRTHEEIQLGHWSVKHVRYLRQVCLSGRPADYLGRKQISQGVCQVSGLCLSNYFGKLYQNGRCLVVQDALLSALSY